MSALLLPVKSLLLKKGRGPRQSPGASHLEDKQERIKQQIVCF